MFYYEHTQELKRMLNMRGKIFVMIIMAFSANALAYPDGAQV
jgi:hypothetical protein